MQQALHRSSLVPRGFVVENAYYQDDKAIIAVRASGSVGLCPSCGTVSRRVHSRYRRRVTDLPVSGRIVQLLVTARRFRCDAVFCGHQIFTERFAEGALAPSARSSARWQPQDGSFQQGRLRLIEHQAQFARDTRRGFLSAPRSPRWRHQA
jgi:transposase